MQTAQAHTTRRQGAALHRILPLLLLLLLSCPVKRAAGAYFTGGSATEQPLKGGRLFTAAGIQSCIASVEEAVQATTADRVSLPGPLLLYPLLLLAAAGLFMLHSSNRQLLHSLHNIATRLRPVPLFLQNRVLLI